jgi:spermidine/putrescine transport system substrate-binding protein
MDLFEQKLGRRDVLRLAVVVGGGSFLAACGGDDEAEPSGATEAVDTQERPPIEQEPGSLSILEYAGYEPQDLWQPYAARFPDEKPTYSFFASDQEALGKVAAGVEADLMHPCSGFIPDFVRSGKVQPWETSLLTNFSDLNPALVEVGQVDGEQYFVPLDWGFISVLYRADEVEPEEDSWMLLFDDRYSGKIVWYDSAQDMLAIGAYALGVPDPWNMSDAELQEVTDFMIDKKKRNVRRIWSNQADMEQDMASGNALISYSWASSWVNLKNKDIDVVYLNPKEGRLAFLCGMMLFEGTENFRHAHAYTDAWASPESGLWLLNNYAYGHSNTKIDLSQVDPTLVEAFELRDPEAIAEPRTHVLKYIERREQYGTAWDEIKAA